MLRQVKKCIASMLESTETFGQYYLNYMKEVQDKNIDTELKRQLRFSILQLSHLDKQIDSDYRKMVNESHAKFN